MLWIGCRLNFESLYLYCMCINVWWLDKEAVEAGWIAVGTGQVAVETNPVVDLQGDG